MVSTLPPRAVIVTRASEYESLLLRHGTHAQARFFLECRGRSLDEVLARHRLQAEAVHAVSAQIPATWRRARVDRNDIDRFAFAPEDVVIAVGQDGLVANVAKSLCGQTVIGVNPAQAQFEGALVRHPPAAVADLLAMSQRGALRIEERSMVCAHTPEGSSLFALNEMFVGHRSHQSARYTLSFAGRSERHSSSGVIVCTGTGATGWARSLARGRVDPPPLPEPTSAVLTFLVREAWPSVSTQASLVHGTLLPAQELGIVSEMNEGGVIFGDGMEEDRLELPFGQSVTLARASKTLRLAA